MLLDWLEERPRDESARRSGPYTQAHTARAYIEPRRRLREACVWQDKQSEMRALQFSVCVCDALRAHAASVLYLCSDQRNYLFLYIDFHNLRIRLLLVQRCLFPFRRTIHSIPAHRPTQTYYMSAFATPSLMRPRTVARAFVYAARSENCAMPACNTRSIIAHAPID